MNTFSYKSGFTLVETLVSILALSLSLGALTLITSRTVVSARNSEQRVQAELLAVEGLEILEQKLISRSMGSTSPAGFLTACANGCGISYVDLQNNAELPACPVGDCSNVSRVLDNSGSSGLPADFGRTGSATAFRRLVYVQPDATGNGYDLRSVVWYTPTTDTLQKSVVLTKEYKPWYVE